MVEKKLQENMRGITRECLENLYASMPRRLRAVVVVDKPPQRLNWVSSVGLAPRSEGLEASDGGKKRKIGKRKKRKSETKEIETSKERAVVDNAGSYTKY